MGVRDRIEPFTRAAGTREAMRFGRTLPGWLRRLLIPAALVVAAIVVIASTQSGGDVDIENLWASVAFLLFIAGATMWVWRKARGEGFEALRWRRLHRRVFWRAAATCLLLSMVSLWFVAFWQWRADYAANGSNLPTWLSYDAHARFFRGLTGWLAFAAAPLVVIEPFAWRLWPASMRTAVRRARAVKILSEKGRITRLDLDPGRGAVGRPEAFTAVQPREPSSEVHCITPHGRRPTGWNRGAADNWWRHAAMTWDGTRLALTDGQGRVYSFPVITAGARGFGEDGDAAGAVSEVVWFTERRFYRSARSAIGDRGDAKVLLLDTRGRRLAEMAAVGFTAGVVADLARSAGVAFAGYDLGTTGQEERTANRLLFPRTRRTVKIVLPNR